MSIENQAETGQLSTNQLKLDVSPGTLYLVATPIGNLADITQRAISVLAQVDVIAAEDTRHSQRSLSHLCIKTKLLVSFHEDNPTAPNLCVVRYDLSHRSWYVCAHGPCI